MEFAGAQSTSDASPTVPRCFSLLLSGCPELRMTEVCYCSIFTQFPLVS